MRIYLKNVSVKYFPDLIWNDSFSLFWRDRPSNKNNNLLGLQWTAPDPQKYIQSQHIETSVSIDCPISLFALTLGDRSISWIQ